MNDPLRLMIEGLAFVLSLLLVVLAVRLARRLHRMDRAALSAEMFLLAPLVREFSVAFAVAIALFVTMPVSILGYLLTDDRMLEVVHDVAHLLFLIVVLVGVLGLARLGRSPVVAEESEVEADAEGPSKPLT